MSHSASSNYILLLVRIPQGENEENTFEQLLTNMHEGLEGTQIAFELASYNQHIYFYIRCPENIREFIEGNVYALYPDAEIEPASNYAASETIQKQELSAAELGLKRSDIYPIATYDRFDKDSLSGIFSVLSKSIGDEQIWIQVVAEALKDNWKLNFVRSWKIKLIKIANIFRLRDYFKVKSKKDIAVHDKEAFNEKATEHCYRVGIRMAYIGANKATASTKIHSLLKAFAQFNTIDFNEFNETSIIRTNAFIQNYANSKFSRKNFTFSVKELASVYHFPNPDTVPHIVHVLARKAEPPRDLPRPGTCPAENLSLFGETNHHNQKFKFGLKRTDRRRHLYVVGKSGTGKSKMLELLIKEDIEAGHGVGVLDPHGDLVDAVINYIPKERINDVVYFNPADSEYPIAFNPLEQVEPEFRIRVAIGFVDIFKKLFGSNWTPRLEHVLRYTTLALLDSPNTTVLSILKMLSDKNYRQKIVANIKDSVIKNFWVNEFAAWSEKFDNEAIMPILNKVGQFVSTSLIRNIIGQPINKINIREIMDKGKILLMRISKGNLGEENAALIGAMVVTKVQQAAMSRTDTPEDQRHDFYLYCDEFQYFATDTFGEILSEARKYHLNLTMAHQFMGQVEGRVLTTAFGNVGTIMSFRVGAEDAAVLAQEYTPVFKVRDIINLGVREFYIKMSVDGEMRDAFSGRTLDVIKPKQSYAKEIIANSRKLYTRPRAEVEKDLASWDESGSSKGPQAMQDEDFAEPLI